MLEPLKFQLRAEEYTIYVEALSDDEDNIRTSVGFQGSAKGIDYEILDTWIEDCEKILYEYENDDANQVGFVQDILREDVLGIIKEALSTSYE